MRTRIHCFAPAVVVVALAFMLGTSQALAAGLDGTWKVRTTFRGGRGRSFILKLDLDGENLKGSVARSEGSVSDIENGTFSDGELSFDVVNNWNGRKFTTTYSGKLEDKDDGDEIRGKAHFTLGGVTRDLDWTGTRTTPTPKPTGEVKQTPPVVADIELTDANYKVWRDHIIPASDEMAWAKIPWLVTFKDGILKADEAQKPLLFWTMNGHPLGCT